MNEYRPKISVSSFYDSDLVPSLAWVALFFDPERSAGILYPSPDRNGPWRLAFWDATGETRIVELDVGVNEAEAVEAAQDHVLKHGWRLEYRGPDIQVVDARQRHDAELPFIYRDYTENNIWRLHFFAEIQPELPVTITMCSGDPDEFTAVEIAKRYVTKYGRLHVEVEVHLDE